MNAAYTPGPWSQSLVRVQRQIFSSIGGAPVAYTHGENVPANVDVANARLIAAAPTMLDALLDALEFVADQEDVVDGPDGQPQANKAMRLAGELRAAIFSATGSAA